MSLEPEACMVVQLLWIVVSTVWFFKRSDELPMIVSLFLFYVFSFRLLALTNGWTASVNLEAFGFERLNDETAASSLFLATLGQSVLLVSYMCTQRIKNSPSSFKLDERGARLIRQYAFSLAAALIPVTIAIRAFVVTQHQTGRSLAFEVSNYLVLFPYALVGTAVLIIAAWRLGAFSSVSARLIALLALMIILVISFGPSSRFQFAGWLMAGVIILCSGMQPMRRIIILFSGGALVAALFGMAGAMRDIRAEHQPEEGLPRAAWDRLLFATDANMLDGMGVLLQVYPDLLEYRKGREHLEILTRPIPRSIWPGKPVGGYMNRLGFFDKDSDFTLGISQSVFGSFYEEGGTLGIIVCSAVYGALIGALMMRATQLHPLSCVLLRGCICAGMIPLLRGGDLPGIYAWIGMAFWPCALAMWSLRNGEPNYSRVDQHAMVNLQGGRGGRASTIKHDLGV